MKALLSIVAFVLLLPAAVLAQVEQAAITGRVFDQSGAVIPGATVTVKRVETGITRETVTNENGQYAVPYLPVGTYEVTVTAHTAHLELESAAH
jgi:hypothetical protein